MTPADFRAARVALGERRGLGRKLTQHEMAEALRLGKWGHQTVAKWEKGLNPIPGPITLAVECLLKH